MAASCTANGWSKIPDSGTTRVRISNGDSAAVRKGDVATLLGWLVRELDASGIEKGVTVNGHRSPSFNAAVGGYSLSNHVSGTAVDYNGRKHPYERNTKPWTSGWSSAQVAQINRMLKFLDSRVAWGLYFQRGFRDGMHFEVKGNASVVKAAAKKISGGTVKTRDRVNVRATASTSAKSVTVLPKGKSIKYTGVVWRGGRPWLRISNGYVAAEFTTV